MSPRALPVLLPLLLWPAAALAGDGVIERWARERALEHAAALHQPHEPEPAVLFRARPEREPIPDFVPPTSLAPLVQAVRAGVVNISTTNAQSARSPLALQQRASRSLGSGFILSADGYVVTNNHVVDRAEVISVRLADGRELPGDIVGRDPSTDVALLKLRGDPRDLPSVYLGDSDLLQVGDWVVAIGNPFGLDHSVSHGMISAKERVIGVGVFDDFVQTDVLINPGNSGGPLFNMRGEVVGVNTAIMSQGQGIGFAVPINMVKDLLPNLRANGRLARGWLGVNIQGAGAAPDPSQKGAVVKDVYQNSPAARAGLRANDRVLSVNGRPVEGYLQLLRRIAILAPGSEARLSVQRAAGAQEIVVRLGERPAPEALQSLVRASEADTLGLLVRDPQERDLAPRGAGVLVAGVLPGSAAERAGIAAGDLISEVNRRRVAGVESWREGLLRARTEPTLLLRVQRGEVARYLALER